MELPEEVAALLLDIEGTTTPISFVYEVLFPWARDHLKDFLRQHWNSEEARADVQRLRQDHAEDVNAGLDPPRLLDMSPEARVESLASYAEWLMDRDRKSTGLKALQGRIWQEGYGSGALQSQVFADVPPAFARWRRQGRMIAIFSSGSVLAQRLLFAHTTAGGLTPHIHAYFDTTTGNKSDPQSYLKIASALQQSPERVLFISDTPAELEAARAVGMNTLLAVRPGNRPPERPVAHATIHDFDEVYP
jgi:enolase-phosphatase E1